MLLQGQKVGDYELQALIEKDFIMETYTASNLITTREAIVKIIRTDLAEPKDDLNVVSNGLWGKANVLRHLHHPNILLRTEYNTVNFNNQDLPCIIIPVRQEKVPVQWLQEHSISVLTPNEVVPIIQQAVDVLTYAHQHNILHSLIAPENFVLRDNPLNPHSPHLLLYGAPTFSAPKEWKRKHKLKSDQYILAMLAYTLLIGSVPSEGEISNFVQTQKELLTSNSNPQFTQYMQFVLAHALEKNEAERFLDLDSFKEAFQSAAQREDMSISLPSVRSSPSLLTSILIVFAIGMIIFSSCIYYFCSYQPGQLYAQATATAQVPTLVAQATATVQTQATATFTSFQNEFAQLTADPPIGSDAMTDSSNPNWPTGRAGSGPHGSCNFTTQGYNVRVISREWGKECFDVNRNISNFVFQIQVQINQGNSVLFFRFSKDPNKNIGYAFILSSSDDYILNINYKLVAYTGPDSKGNLLMEGKTIPIVPGERYQVAIVARGNTFSIYLNGSYVNSTRDNAATANSGIIGLGADPACIGTATGTFCANTADVVYTQLQVWLL